MKYRIKSKKINEEFDLFGFYKVGEFVGWWWKKQVSYRLLELFL